MATAALQITKSLAEQAKHLDDLVEKQMAVQLQVNKGQGFAAAIAMADAMEALMSSITPEMVDKFMRLQNTSLGFKTDRDPTKKKKDRNGQYTVTVDPYDRDTVKVCVAQAVLQGVQLINNQFNIIAGGPYITLNGYAYMLKKLPEFFNLETSLGRPQYSADKSEASVRCSATWIYKNVAGSIGADEKLPCIIAVPVGEYTSMDAILGKVKRKFLKRIYEQVTGCEVMPDGEVEFESPALPAAPIKTAERVENTPGTATEVKLEGNVSDRIKALCKRDSVTDDQVLAVLKKKGIADSNIVDLYQLSDAKLTQAETAWPAISSESKKLT